jgi:hypothetical protein
MLQTISLVHAPPGADQSRYLKLKDDLSNNMTKGVNNFPKTMVETLQLMSNCKVPA